MNKEDYLWDKTGSDPEIEKLENALAVFRYKETAPPELPAKVLPFVKKETAPRRYVGFAYAAAACLAFVALALGVWLQISGRKHEVAAVPVEIPAKTITPPQVADQTPAAVPVEVTEKPDVKIARRIFKPRVVKIQKPVLPAKQTALPPKIKDDAMALSKEEKYAYDQLMLALAITGSKLKLVSDKIDGR